MKLLVMKFSQASSYFLPPRPKCYHHAISFPHNTTASKTAGAFSVPPALKIHYSKYLTARIIMITFSYSVEALAVLFRTSFILSLQGVSLPPSMILNIVQYNTNTCDYSV